MTAANELWYDGRTRECFYVEGIFIDAENGSGKEKYLGIFTEKGVIDTRIPMKWLEVVMTETKTGFPSMSCRPEEVIRREEYINGKDA